MSALKICPTCNTEYPANERFCPRDGTALRSQGGGNDLVGTVLAERYHVLKKLGEGGMGQVYLAEHVKMGRKSAVKVMHPAMIHDAGAIGRFNREAANASRINHPNVAGIYDFGETPEGLVYLAMEFIEGETLTDLLKANGALPPLRAAEIARQTAEALHVAHEMGIVHRDLKPDNIMITKDHDGDDCVKVVDFGIAKAAGGEGQNVTRTGMVVGTPEYMSPEQLSGDKLDGRSDLYSLGLVTFNMLTGRLPFPSETTQSAMIARLTEEPRPLAEMKADVSWPPEMQAVMDRVLARDVNKRYQKAREFGRAIVDAAAQMPARASAGAGTMVIAPVAPNGQTAPRSARPTPGGSVPAAGGRAGSPRRSRVPLIAGVVELLGAAGAFAVMRDGGRASEPPRPPKDSSGRTRDTGSIHNAGVAGQPTPNTAPDTLTRIVDPTPDTLAITKALASALKHASSEGTARKAIAEADRISAEAARPEDKVMAGMVRVQAYGTLGQDSKSCAALRDIAPVAQGTRYESQVTSNLALCK